MSFNKLESCLVLSPKKAFYFTPDGAERRSPVVPVGGILIHDRLKPCKDFPDDRELSARKDLLRKYIESLKQGGYILGDLTKGGRKPTLREAKDLHGVQGNGVPKGSSVASGVVNGMGPVSIRSRILGILLSRFTVSARTIIGVPIAVIFFMNAS